MSKSKSLQRLMAIFMTVAMILGMTPVSAFADDGNTPTLGISGEITAFAPLDESVANQSYENVEQMNLSWVEPPEALTVMVRLSGDEAATPGTTDEIVEADIPVQWDMTLSEETADGGRITRFTAVIGAEFTLAQGLELPQITITVAELAAPEIDPLAAVGAMLDFVTNNTSVTNAADGYAWDSGTSTLTLSGLNLTSSTQYALKLPANSKIVVTAGTTNTITHNTAIPSIMTISCPGNLTVEGSGTLTVNTTTTATGPLITATGFTVTSGGNLTIKGGTVTATATATHAPGSTGTHGISCGTLEIEGGTVIASGTTSAFSQDYVAPAGYTYWTNTTTTPATGPGTVSTNNAITDKITAGMSGDKYAKIVVPAAGGNDTYVPLTVASGFNVDIIADSYPATGSTTDAVDFGGDSTTANFSFYSKGYVADYNTQEAAAIANSGGLPDNGLVTTDNASLNAGVKFQLGSYTVNNALKLKNGNTTGTLAFTNAGKYSRVSILGTGGSGDSTISVVVNYTDNTSSAATDFTCKDWYNNPGYIMSYMGRIYRGAPGGSHVINEPLAHGSGGPNLYGFEVTTDPSKNIKSIHLIQTSRTNPTDTTSVIMAVSGVVLSGEADPNNTPTPAPLVPPAPTTAPTTSSRSSGNSGSRSPSYTPAPPNPWLEPNPAQSLVSGTSSQQDSVRTKSDGTYGVRKAAWKKLEGYSYHHDTIDGNSVGVRLYIDNPAAMTRDAYPAYIP